MITENDDSGICKLFDNSEIDFQNINNEINKKDQWFKENDNMLISIRHIILEYRNLVNKYEYETKRLYNISNNINILEKYKTENESIKSITHYAFGFLLSNEENLKTCDNQSILSNDFNEDNCDIMAINSDVFELFDEKDSKSFIDLQIASFKFIFKYQKELCENIKKKLDKYRDTVISISDDYEKLIGFLKSINPSIKTLLNENKEKI